MTFQCYKQVVLFLIPLISVSNDPRYFQFSGVSFPIHGTFEVNKFETNIKTYTQFLS